MIKKLKKYQKTLYIISKMKPPAKCLSSYGNLYINQLMNILVAYFQKKLLKKQLTHNLI